MTETMSVAESTVLFVAVLLTLAAVARHLPRWAIFVLDAAAANYALLSVLRDGPSVENVSLTALFALVALAVWWRDLRGHA